MDVLGLGREQLLTVPAPKQTLDPAKALRIGKRYQEEGNKLLAIVGVGGTTETGHVDPLDELAVRHARFRHNLFYAQGFISHVCHNVLCGSQQLGAC